MRTFKKLIPWILGLVAVFSYADEGYGADIGYGFVGYGDEGYETIGYPEESPANQQADSVSSLPSGLPSVGKVGDSFGKMGSFLNKLDKVESVLSRTHWMIALGDLVAYEDYDDEYGSSYSTRINGVNGMVGWQMEFMEGFFTPVLELSAEVAYYEAEFTERYRSSEWTKWYSCYDGDALIGVLLRINNPSFYVDGGGQVGYGYGKMEGETMSGLTVAVPVSFGYKFSNFVVGGRLSYIVKNIWGVDMNDDENQLVAVKFQLFVAI